MEPETLTAVTFFQLPAGTNIELDEVSMAIDEIISKYTFDGYEVDDKRMKFESGASGCGQEIIFGITIGISANISCDILKAIYSWAKNKIYQKEKKITSNLEDQIEAIKDIIIKYFSPTNELSILEINKTVTVIKARVEDNDGNKYQVELLPCGKIIKIKKITTPNKV